jgi:AraC-like DNA-binding protein
MAPVDDDAFRRKSLPKTTEPAAHLTLARRATILLSMAGRPALPATGPSAIAPALLRYLHGRGVDPAELSDADRESTELPVTPSALATMLARACELLAEPHLALRLPCELPMKRYDAFALAARAARTPRAVIDLVVRYAPLVFPGLAATIESDAGELRVSWTIAAHPRGLGIEVDELLLATVLGYVARGVLFSPVRVWLASARPPAITPLFAAMRTEEIDFGARTTGFALASADADRELPGADPMLLATATDLADAALARVPRRGAFAALVATHIEAALGGGSTPSADDVSAALRMSTRTLQRRLDEEGTKFSEVVDAARERRARVLLDDLAVPLGEVAYRSGFADLATFSRAFKRWSGMPPGAFRRRRP